MDYITKPPVESVGLINNGLNSCFLVVILQFLYSIDTFRNMIFNLDTDTLNRIKIEEDIRKKKEYDADPNPDIDKKLNLTKDFTVLLINIQIIFYFIRSKNTKMLYDKTYMFEIYKNILNNIYNKNIIIHSYRLAFNNSFEIYINILSMIYNNNITNKLLNNDIFNTYNDILTNPDSTIYQNYSVIVPFIDIPIMNSDVYIYINKLQFYKEIDSINKYFRFIENNNKFTKYEKMLRKSTIMSNSYFILQQYGMNNGLYIIDEININMSLSNLLYNNNYKIHPDNKHLIIYINRYDNFKKFYTNMFLNIDNKTYYLMSSIVDLQGHFIYLTINNGLVQYMYNDSYKSECSNKSGCYDYLINNSIMLLYKRFDRFILNINNAPSVIEKIPSYIKSNNNSKKSLKISNIEDELYKSSTFTKTTTSKVTDTKNKSIKSNSPKSETKTTTSKITDTKNKLIKSSSDTIVSKTTKITKKNNKVIKNNKNLKLKLDINLKVKQKNNKIINPKPTKNILTLLHKIPKLKKVIFKLKSKKSSAINKAIDSNYSKVKSKIKPLKLIMLKFPKLKKISFKYK